MFAHANKGKKTEAKQKNNLAARKKKRERKKWYVVTRAQVGSEHARGKRPVDEKEEARKEEMVRGNKETRGISDARKDVAHGRG